MQERNPTIESILIIRQAGRRKMIKFFSEHDRQNKDLERMGILFGILDNDLEPAENAEILNIITRATEQFYKSQKNYDSAFDDFIGGINRQINPSEGCRAAFGVLKNNSVIFCGTSGIWAHLISTKGVKKILPEIPDAEEKNDKLFSHALSGEIFGDYVLYFCNENFNDYMSAYALGDFIKKYGADYAVNSIKDNIFKITDLSQAVGLFIFHPSQKNHIQKPTESILDLMRTEEAAQNRLSPSLTKTIQALLKKRTVPIILTELFIKILKTFFHALRFLLKKIFIYTLSAFFIATNFKDGRAGRIRLLKDELSGAKTHIINFYRNLSTTSKIALIGGFIASIALSIGITYAVDLKEKQDNLALYRNKMELAEKLSNEADSNMLFQEKRGALQKIKEAIVGLEAVPALLRDDAYLQRYESLKKMMQKIQNISEIKNPMAITDLSAYENISLFPPLFIHNGKICVGSNDELLKIDAEAQTIQRQPLKTRRWNGISYYDTQKKILYSFEGESSFQAINPEKTADQILEISLQTGEVPRDFAVYGDKAYVLSFDGKEISVWKHNPSIAGFGRPTIAAKNHPAEGIIPLAMDVDGAFYILYSENNIEKYYRGEKATWNFKPENTPDGLKYFDILADENHENIYLMGKNAISILSKNGDFLGHLIFSSLNDITGIAIDEKTKTAYVLSGKKIYAVAYNI